MAGNELTEGGGRSCRSVNTPRAGEIFHKIGGLDSAFGGFGHPGGDLAGPGEVLGGEDRAQVRDERSRGSGRQAPRGAYLQASDLSAYDRLVADRPQDQRGDSGAQACGRGADGTVVRDRAAGRKDVRVVDRTHDLDVVEKWHVAEVTPGGAY